MNESLFVPSSPEQAQQVMNEIEALRLRELGEPGQFGTEYPGVERSSMPSFIVDRYVIAPFELQKEANDTDCVSPGFDPDAPGDFYRPLASVGFSRELTALHARSLTQVTYCVVRTKNEATERDELGLNATTTFDVDNFSASFSEENQVNQPLRDAQELRRKMQEDPFAAHREVENLLFTPSVGDLVLTDEQKERLEPATVGYKEADLLITFLHSLYRTL